MGVNVGVFGELAERRQEFCKAVAKKDSEADLSYYSNVLGGKVVSVLEPTLYPEKLQPAVFAAHLADYCVLVADAPSKVFAETVVLLDLLEKKAGCIVTQAGLKPLLEKTLLKDYSEFPSWDGARDAVFALQRDDSRDGHPVRAVVDSSFEVKGVGNVALGVVERGVLKVHDELKALPCGKQVGVKSIQVHDVDVKQAVAGDRFGIAFKGASVADVARGTVLGGLGDVTREAKVSMRASPFAGQPVEASESLHAVVGLQFVECRVSSEVAPGAEKQVEVVFERDVVFEPGEACLLCRLNSKGNRAVASFKL
ncbi:MAG: EF-Tu/IF-2/RF-3 family GTPase [Candidatus Micrarchaeota archaeon]